MTALMTSHRRCDNVIASKMTLFYLTPDISMYIERDYKLF